MNSLAEASDQAAEALRKSAIAIAKDIQTAAVKVQNILEQQPLTGDTFKELAEPACDIVHGGGLLHGSIGGMAIAKGVSDAGKTGHAKVVIVGRMNKPFGNG